MVGVGLTASHLQEIKILKDLVLKGKWTEAETFIEAIEASDGAAYNKVTTFGGFLCVCCFHLDIPVCRSPGARVMATLYAYTSICMISRWFLLVPSPLLSSPPL